MEAGPVIILPPILQRRKQRLREVQSLALGHTAGSCRAAWLPPYCLVSESPVMLSSGVGSREGRIRISVLPLFLFFLSLFFLFVCYGCSEF